MYSEGDQVIDKDSDERDKLIVCNITDDPISETIAYWESSTKKVTVSDLNESYDYDEPTVKAVYKSRVKEIQENRERYDEVKFTLERVNELRERHHIKEYSFPRSRLSIP